MTDFKLIVGLGNPGPDYMETRHNVGFMWLDRLGYIYNITFKFIPKFFSDLAKLELNNNTYYLIKPKNYMNNSGQSTLAVANYYKIKPEEILIIHDEIDLECGYIKTKFAGGHGGHNGLRDIISKLGSNNFYRLRIGVGHPGHKDLVHNHVLQRAPAEDQKKIEMAIEASLDLRYELFNQNWDLFTKKIHTQYNK